MLPSDQLENLESTLILQLVPSIFQISTFPPKCESPKYKWWNCVFKRQIYQKHGGDVIEFLKVTDHKGKQNDEDGDIYSYSDFIKSRFESHHASSGNWKCDHDLNLICWKTVSLNSKILTVDYSNFCYKDF